MSTTHDEVAELLGAWALDACERAEAASVERHLESCAECRAEAASLSRAAAALGELAGSRSLPPDGLAGAVVELTMSASTPATLFGHRAQALAGLLDTIGPEEWAAHTAAGWTVHELVAHLLAGASYINWQLGLLGADPGAGELAWLPRSEAVIAGQRGSEPARTVQEWRAQAELLHRHLSGAAGHEISSRDGVSSRLNASIPWFGEDTPVRVVAVVHAFETWVHAEDIRLATGRPPEAPTMADLETMSRVAAELLGNAMGASPTARGRTARLTLTGAGGGELDVPPGHGAAPDVTVTADVVTFCRLVGGRVRPADFAHRTDGDAELGRELVETAASFAFP